MALIEPAPGSYLVVVDLSEAAEGMTWDLTSAVVSAAARSLTVTPESLHGDRGRRGAVRALVERACTTTPGTSVSSSTRTPRRAPWCGSTPEPPRPVADGPPTVSGDARARRGADASIPARGDRTTCRSRTSGCATGSPSMAPTTSGLPRADRGCRSRADRAGDGAAARQRQRRHGAERTDRGRTPHRRVDGHDEPLGRQRPRMPYAVTVAVGRARRTGRADGDGIGRRDRSTWAHSPRDRSPSRCPRRAAASTSWSRLLRRAGRQRLDGSLRFVVRGWSG